MTPGPAELTTSRRPSTTSSSASSPPAPCAASTSRSSTSPPASTSRARRWPGGRPGRRSSGRTRCSPRTRRRPARRARPRLPRRPLAGRRGGPGLLARLDAVRQHRARGEDARPATPVPPAGPAPGRPPRRRGAHRARADRATRPELLRTVAAGPRAGLRRGGRRRRRRLRSLALHAVGPARRRQARPAARPGADRPPWSPRPSIAVNAEAERSGAIVLAEGIETAQHLRTARAFGATLGQGWLFGRPGPLPPRARPPRAGSSCPAG